MSPLIPTDILHYLCTIIHSTFPPPLALQTLKSCSLTSHAFLDPARARIFHKIRLTDTSNRCHFSSFIAFTEENPRIALYVRDLLLEATLEMLTHDELGVLLRSLAALEVLTVRCRPETIVWRKIGREVRSALEWLVKGEGRLRVLSLGSVQFPLEMLVGCASLRRLEMKGDTLVADDDTFGKESPTSEMPDSELIIAQLESLRISNPTEKSPTSETLSSKHITRLESLKISNSTIRTRLLLYLASTPDSGFDFSFLRQLSFAPVTSVDLEIINIFLLSFSDNPVNAVEELEVDLLNPLARLRAGGYINSLARKLTLAPLSHLRTLTIRILPRRFRTSRFPRELCVILRSIEDPFNSKLEEIRIVLTLSSRSDDKEIFMALLSDDWRELDTLLTTPAGSSPSAIATDDPQRSSLYFPALRRLIIQVFNDTFRPDISGSRVKVVEGDLRQLIGGYLAGTMAIGEGRFEIVVEFI